MYCVLGWRIFWHEGHDGPSPVIQHSSGGSAVDTEEAQSKEQARLDAIEIGRLAGRLEAESRREDEETTEERVRQAMAYAAWDFDGRSADSNHLVEFGITPKATPSLERPSPQPATSLVDDS